MEDFSKITHITEDKINMQKFCFFIKALIFLCFFFHSPNFSYGKGQHRSAKKVVVALMDPKSGKIIDGLRYEESIYPASLTKIMTLYLLFEDIEKKRFSLKTPFYVSILASKQPPSKISLKPKSCISVHNCILALSLRSANDVAMVVAQNCNGSSARFVQRMNKMAKKLGMHHTVFQNPSGWHHPKQVTTAHDMALLLRALWLRFPSYAKFLGIRSAKICGKNMRSTNKTLMSVPGMVLGKTGYTNPAGFNLATLTKRNGKEVIVVAMRNATAKKRDHNIALLTETYYKDPYLLSSILELEDFSSISQGKNRKFLRTFFPKKLQQKNGSKTVLFSSKKLAKNSKKVFKKSKKC